MSLYSNFFFFLSLVEAQSNIKNSINVRMFDADEVHVLENDVRKSFCKSKKTEHGLP